MSPQPRMAVVIVNYNTAADTSICIRSVLAHTATPTEVVVVDNGSTDGSVATFREDFPDITVVDAERNVGFAAGVNLGVASSTAPWIVLLNPDTVVHDGALDALLRFALAHPAHGLYGGRTLRPDGTTDPSSCWGEMTPWSLTSFALGLSTVFKGSLVFDPESLGRWQRDTVREVPIITGCLLLTARTTWESLGGMDETYFLYGEDADFSARARARGLRPVIVPEATIVHAVGGSTASSGRKMCMVMAGKATTVRSSWRPAAASVGVALLQTGALTRALLSRVRRRRHATWDEVWRRRRDWRAGYPHAEAALFAPTSPTHTTAGSPA